MGLTGVYVAEGVPSSFTNCVRWFLLEYSRHLFRLVITSVDGLDGIQSRRQVWCRIDSSSISAPTDRPFILILEQEASNYNKISMSYQNSILRRFDSLRDQAKDALLALSSCVCKPAATVKVNGRTCT
jgi:hypothetical protein